MVRAVISLCDRSGVFVQPWAVAGYECWCVDVQHSIRRERTVDGIHFVWGDVRSWVPPSGLDIAFVAAFPPCTHVAVSGARDFQRKGPAMLADALTLFAACEQAARWSGSRYLIENPVGVLSSHVRKPDFTFDPCEFAGYLESPTEEAYTKKTCLWTGGGFVMPERKPVAASLGSKMHTMTPSSDRANQRSLTPMGFARAVYEFNHK